MSNRAKWQCKSCKAYNELSSADRDVLKNKRSFSQFCGFCRKLQEITALGLVINPAKGNQSKSNNGWVKG